MSEFQCVCAGEGYCHHWGRAMPGAFWRLCKGGAGIDLATREQAIAAWSARRKEPAPVIARDVPCRHLGPRKLLAGEPAFRDCPSCNGNVREKLFLCGVHGDCTLKDCRKCRQFERPYEEPGGMGERYDARDHWGLSFTRAAGTALYRAEGTAVDLRRCFAGQTAFFLGGGPSLLDHDLAQLEGCLTIAANGVCEVYPSPTVWLAVDPPNEPPDRFRGVPWTSPDTLKLLPRAFAGAPVGQGLVMDQPSTLFFLRGARFDPWRFISERAVNWGSDKEVGGGRSVMLAALKLLWYFGVSRVVLLGCDFHMTPDRPYAHSAPKDETGCSSNNVKFGQLNERFKLLRPVLEAEGMTVVNATPGSALTAFDRVALAGELAACSM